ncbi:MAG: hypothetical protein II837_05830 [Treponema sp.]|nr:hypothetical protein [Treponema sp.]
MADELTPQEGAVKAYLDSQTVADEALRNFYVPSKIKDCFKYVTEQAQKEAVNGCAMIEDAQVYKWARDYYIEVLPKEADKSVVEVVQEKVKAEAKPKAKAEKKAVDELQGLLFAFNENSVA